MSSSKEETKALLDAVDAYNELVSQMPESYQEAHRKTGKRTDNLAMFVLGTGFIISWIGWKEIGLIAWFMFGPFFMLLPHLLLEDWRKEPIENWYKNQSCE